MKFKQLLTKSLLVAVCLLVGQSVWATELPYTFGSLTDGGWGKYPSDTYTLEGYGTYHLNFTTTNDGNTDQWWWHTWLLHMWTDDSNVDCAFRGTDGYAWQGNTYNSTDNSAVFVTSKSEGAPSESALMTAMNGATVDVVITHKSQNINVAVSVTPSTGNGNPYTMSFDYLVGNASADNLKIRLLTEYATVTLNTAEQTEKWSTVWSTDFSSAPTGITYTITNGGQVSISNGYLMYDQYSGSGGRTGTTTFTGSEFAVDTDWIMDFDWNCSGGNSQSGSGSFSTSNTTKSTTFTLTYTTYGSIVTIKDADGKDITTTLPGLSYNNRTAGMTASSHFTLRGVVDDGVYLTVTNGGVTYVNNVKVTSYYGYPKTFVNEAAKNLGRCYLDNIVFQTPAVAGFVATPTSEITKADGTNRKFTLNCLTDGATIYYATYDLEKGAAGWVEYTGEVSTDATTIYAYAKDNENNTSDKMNFETGAGTTIDLRPATVTHSNNGVYTIASNQSSILGAPTATIHYQIDGGAEQTTTNASVNVNIAVDGTLTYWLTAEGYGATDPANETVYGPVAYAVTQTLNFCTSSSTVWAYGNVQNYDLSTIEVTTVNTDRKYYKYLDQNSNVIGDGLLAVSAVNGGSSWRIDKSSAGVHPYNNTEYVVLLGMEAGQLIQIAASSAPSSTSNLTAVPAATYTGTYTYTATADGEVIFSLAKNVVLKTIKLCETSVSKTISNAGWATYCSPYALDLEHATGLTDAYIVTGGSEGVLQKTSVKNGTVPANTGLLLKGAAGTATIPVVVSSETNVSANKFVGVTANTEIAEEAGYVLMNDETNGLGFYKNSNAFTVGANTAYLPASFDDGGARASYLLFDDMTGISQVAGSKVKTNGVIYNLNGQRVSNPTKGIYIIDGVKVAIE